ncbi:hypothetical protein [Actinoplanes sp. NPDC049599]|uniref:hypothetical protein n=1 Tax=Actinoplanes sp. NPDC049599 TaxID=3363903 RepID=UPI0037883024
MTGTVARPPRSWELGTVTLLLAVAATAGFSVFCLVSDLALRHALQTDGGGKVSPWLIWVVEHTDVLATVNLLLILVYVGGFYRWRRRSRDILRRFVSNPDTQVRHWSILAWYAALVATVLISLTNFGAEPGNRDEAVSTLGVNALHWGVRTVGLALLAIGIVQIRDRVRRVIAEPRIPAPAAPRPAPAAAPAGSAPVTATAPKSPVRVLEPVPGSAGLPPADDAFWERVRDTAADADLALLQRTGGQAYGWKLVPAGGDISTVRAALRAGAVVTVFTETPSAQAPGKKYKPVAAEEYHGFLESGETGAIWYQPVDRWRLQAFLTRAGSAGRWALYPVTDAAALRAVVPAEQ